MDRLRMRTPEDRLKRRLQRLAKKNGRRKSEEARDIRDDVREDRGHAAGLGTEISSLFRGHGVLEDLPELRGHVVRPATWDS